MQTQGHALFEAARNGAGASKVAAQLTAHGTPTGESTVRAWLKGSVPTPDYRRAIEAVFSVPFDSWTKPASKGTDTPGTKKPPAPGTTPSSAPRKAAKKPTKAPARVVRPIEELTTLLAEVDGQLAGTLSFNERGKAQKEKRVLLLAIQKAQLEVQLHESRIVLEHPSWRRLRDTLLAILARHPAALAEVLDALEGLT